MINNEYKNSSEVYKVQTFRTTQLTIAIDKLIRIYNDYDINDLLTEGTC